MRVFFYLGDLVFMARTEHFLAGTPLGRVTSHDKGEHVLVRTNNRTTMAYINRQSDMLRVWAFERLLALHVPGL